MTELVTIEVTSRVRVPANINDAELRAINIAAAQAVTEAAVDACQFATCVLPLQDVLIYPPRT